jgi:hypothetical protein
MVVGALALGRLPMLNRSKGRVHFKGSPWFFRLEIGHEADNLVK